MTIYDVTVYCDMAHIMAKIEQQNVPMHIKQFINEKIILHVDVATDIGGLGARFHMLKDEYEKHNPLTYGCIDDTVNITYDLDKFNPNRMCERKSLTTSFIPYFDLPHYS